ncbi:MAG: hypothetical protein LBD25_06310, partial [Coriobacteriales bacterium]|nr:hypothetical protein [Coriobacteriales bacterium]
NLDEALALAPWCIDVSSGAERNGIKDGALIHKLVEHTRAHGARRSRPSPQSPARAFAPCPDERASIPSPSQEERNNR